MIDNQSFELHKILFSHNCFLVAQLFRQHGGPLTRDDEQNSGIVSYCMLSSVDEYKLVLNLSRRKTVLQELL